MGYRSRSIHDEILFAKTRNAHLRQQLRHTNASNGRHTAPCILPYGTTTTTTTPPRNLSPNTTLTEDECHASEGSSISQPLPAPPRHVAWEVAEQSSPFSVPDVVYPGDVLRAEGAVWCCFDSLPDALLDQAEMCLTMTPSEMSEMVEAEERSGGDALELQRFFSGGEEIDSAYGKRRLASDSGVLCVPAGCCGRFLSAFLPLPQITLYLLHIVRFRTPVIKNIQILRTANSPPFEIEEILYEMNTPDASSGKIMVGERMTFRYYLENSGEDEEGPPEVTWFAGGLEVAHNTLEYTAVHSDIGKPIALELCTTTPLGDLSPACLVETTLIVAPPQPHLTSLSICGDPTVGQTLSASLTGRLLHQHSPPIALVWDTGNKTVQSDSVVIDAEDAGLRYRVSCVQYPGVAAETAEIRNNLRVVPSVPYVEEEVYVVGIPEECEVRWYRVLKGIKGDKKLLVSKDASYTPTEEDQGAVLEVRCVCEDEHIPYLPFAQSEPVEYPPKRAIYPDAKPSTLVLDWGVVDKSKVFFPEQIRLDVDDIPPNMVWEASVDGCVTWQRIKENSSSVQTPTADDLLASFRATEGATVLGQHTFLLSKNAKEELIGCLRLGVAGFIVEYEGNVAQLALTSTGFKLYRMDTTDKVPFFKARWRKDVTVKCQEERACVVSAGGAVVVLSFAKRGLRDRVVVTFNVFLGMGYSRCSVVPKEVKRAWVRGRCHGQNADPSAAVAFDAFLQPNRTQERPRPPLFSHHSNALHALFLY